MDLSSLQRDSAKVEAGEWVGDIPGFGEARLRVRGLESTAFAATRARKERAVPRNQRERDGTLKSDAARRIFGEALADVILLDWDGITEGGKTVPYDAERAALLLTNPDFSPFADAVVWAASFVDRARVADAAEVGNGLPKSSKGR
ncbi:hypothetical protein FPY71_07240 [Aureimonas fodinaquatilis]|uniref:Uncharacterized protein n=1 Tax=Aureimonas fodinaquatilis TaxID=2565783 RepID=A0A5B0DWW7_9HYPH|nr:hypothetical protein [Aureimonas fodinaquatilis]KAA0970311.1 hypothetical protein FPY71_07240 [Aureimonas fodinaquatilis]